MGYYIETGSAKGKVAYLVNKFDAMVLDKAPEKLLPDMGDMAIICVVDNGPYEAAAYCFSNEELKEFQNPRDYRKKTWLLLNKAIAEKESGYKR